ncbi:MAG TPA: cobalamin-independent methionine synthase II family protein [Bryobacteraceae bacterium]|nr:cobalamin-independent methionine synthase II family protein [Bryobacteraceae bacterium]
MKTEFRAEHVGSLLRPPDLLQARQAHAEGRLPSADLQLLEDRAIREAIQKQRDIGLDILTDGEMRRGSWLTDMADAVEGFVPQKVVLDWKGPGGGPEASSANAVGAKLRKARKLTGHEIPILHSMAPEVFRIGDFKVTLPAPSNFMVSSYKPGLSDRFYPTRSDLLRELAGIVRDEVEWLVSQGITYIQFDAPFYSHYLDPEHRQEMQSQGRNPDSELAEGIAADNAALAGVPRDRVTTAMHVCRGNSRGRWFTEGGYGAIARALFGAVDVDRFLLEYDDERSGDFEPLREVPRGRTVVLGLITTKWPQLESPDLLRRRIDEATRCIPLQNLAISPQCGFASVAAGNLISIDDQWRKLELVAATARAVWGAA